MKRDLDLVRAILLAMEANRHGLMYERVEVEGYSDEQIGYHCDLMIQAGLVDGTTFIGTTSPQARATNIRWAGHEFLDLARDEARWRRAHQLLDAAGGAPLSVWIDVLSRLTLKDLPDGSTS
jgi:hypothetical protein